MVNNLSAEWTGICRIRRPRVVTKTEVCAPFLSWETNAIKSNWISYTNCRMVSIRHHKITVHRKEMTLKTPPGEWI